MILRMAFISSRWRRSLRDDVDRCETILRRPGRIKPHGRRAAAFRSDKPPRAPRRPH